MHTKLVFLFSSHSIVATNQLLDCCKVVVILVYKNFLSFTKCPICLQIGGKKFFEKKIPKLNCWTATMLLETIVEFRLRFLFGFVTFLTQAPLFEWQYLCHHRVVQDTATTMQNHRQFDQPVIGKNKFEISQNENFDLGQKRNLCSIFVTNSKCFY